MFRGILQGAVFDKMCIRDRATLKCVILKVKQFQKASLVLTLVDVYKRQDYLHSACEQDWER